MGRKGYEQSLHELGESAEVLGEMRERVEQRPRFDDADPGPSLLRAHLENVDFLDLTLPGLYVGRSELRDVSFAGSDLHLSTVNWTDLTRCDLAGCDLAGSDLRGNTFEECSFGSADLSGADLRCSAFQDCDFAGARMEGAILTRDQATTLSLSEGQRAAVAWTDEAGLPEG